MGARRNGLADEIEQLAADALNDRNPSYSREESIARARAGVEAVILKRKREQASR